MSKQIRVSVRNVYGIETLYPACPTSAFFCALAGLAVTVTAQSIASAVATVLEAEGAPERAIVKIERVKGAHR